MPIIRTDRGLSLGLYCSIIAIVGSLGRDDYQLLSPYLRFWGFGYGAASSLV